MASFSIKLSSPAFRQEVSVQVTASHRIADIRTMATSLFHDPAPISQWVFHFGKVELKDSDTIERVGVQPGGSILVNQNQADTLTIPDPPQTATKPEATGSIQVSKQTSRKAIAFVQLPSGICRTVEVAEGDTPRLLLERLDYAKGKDDTLALHFNDTALEDDVPLGNLQSEKSFTVSLKAPGASNRDVYVHTECFPLTKTALS